MRVEQLDLNLLLALDILLEEQNITRASERLHLSQSATSSILARLRSYFEDDLLVQVGRTMQPTPYALELLQPVRQVLSIVRGSITSKRQHDLKSSQRHFRIIASDYMVQVIFCPLLASVAEIAPNMTFEFLTPFSHGADLLAKGSADLFIAPEANMIDGYPKQFFTADKLICIGDATHYANRSEINEDQFFSTGHVTVGFQRISRFSIETWFEETLGKKRKIEIITNDFNTLSRAIINSNRLAVIPEKYFLQQTHLPLKQLNLPFQLPVLTECITWHPTLDGDPIHKWLRQLISRFLNSERSE